MTSRHVDVSRIVRMLMGLRDMNQADVGEALGIHQTGVSRLLKGQRRWTVDDLDALAKLFDVPVTTFFEDPESLLRSRCFDAAAGQLLAA